MRVAVVVFVLVAAVACAGESPGTRDELIGQGRETYASRCAPCHGRELSGTTDGPSFLDPIYAPDHHPDEAFHRAVEEGVQPHHWNFGPMPPQPALSNEDVEAIIAYVRSRQRDAGIAG